MFTQEKGKSPSQTLLPYTSSHKQLLVRNYVFALILIRIQNEMKKKLCIKSNHHAPCMYVYINLVYVKLEK